METRFKEKQKFSGWVLGLISSIMIPFALLLLYAIYQQLYLGEPFGDKPGSDLSLIVLLFIPFGLLLFFWTLTLNTEIDKHSIKIHYFPFFKKEIKWETIATAKVVDYGFVGGWGIRFTSRYGTVYNTKGKMGLAIELKNGKKLLIGTQKSAEIEKLLAQF